MVLLIPDAELRVNRLVVFEFVNERDGEVLHRDVTLTVIGGDELSLCCSVSVFSRSLDW